MSGTKDMVTRDSMSYWEELVRGRTDENYQLYKAENGDMHLWLYDRETPKGDIIRSIRSRVKRRLLTREEGETLIAGQR